jgi:hydrogenase maturation protease
MNASENDKRVLVIGYGNPLRGDDGVGLVAALQLGRIVDPDHVATMGVHQLMPELAETISRFDRVIFIDAAADRPAGYLTSRVVEPVDANRLMTHHFTPEVLLALSQRLFGKYPEAHLLTIAGSNFGHRDDLSPAVQRACDKLVDHLAKTLAGALSHA